VKEDLMEPLLTAEEVAQLLGVSANYVWAKAKEGLIPSVRIGRNRRFRRQDLEQWLERLAQA
jgi:excisionase family DNA binding protein